MVAEDPRRKKERGHRIFTKSERALV